MGSTFLITALVLSLPILLKLKVEFVGMGSVIKVGLLPSKKNCFIYFNESPLKMMKNAFYFILIAFFRSQDI